VDVSVITALEALPQSGVTPTVLQTLDKVVPGAWSNVTRFDDLVAEILKESSLPATPGLIAEVRKRALALEAANPRFGQAVAVYTLVDTVDTVAAGAVAAAKVGSLFSSLGFLQDLTPKPDTTQAIDAGAKLIAEMIAFGLTNGVPSMSVDGIARFTGALADYARYDLIRVAAWVTFDGLVPLGPDFVSKIVGTWKGLAQDQLMGNAAFAKLASQVPGNSAAEKQAFVVQALDQTGAWVSRFVKEKGLTQESTLKQVQAALGVADGGLDYVAAAIDASTTYFSHTGTQTVARALARRALHELRDEVWSQWVKSR
jgi:hypothetical protein